jgi:prevent-host-death family protein
MVSAWRYRQTMVYPLTAAQAHLGELVAETRQSHRPVTISEHGQPVAALISIDDLADLEDRAALAAPPGRQGRRARRNRPRRTGCCARPDRCRNVAMSLTVVFRHGAS